MVWKRSEGFALLAELEQPADALYVTKTACDAFYKTRLAQVLSEQQIQQFVVCGCATDYCVDTTIKNGASRGYAITVAEDAHTTANRPAAQATTLIDHYNDVWRTLTVPGNPVRVKSIETILAEWQTN
jgi:nicotinamidase-related amidase